ncbi:MAG: hypothetical protein VCB25_00445 [Myxococcota bacterium]
MSVLHGAYFNVMLINLMPLVVFGIPLVATRSSFGRAASEARSGVDKYLE